VCKELEDSGIRSYRATYASEQEQHKIQNDPNYYAPTMLDIRWNDTCNLACNYCGPRFSSAWARMQNVDLGLERFHYDATLEWLKNNEDQINVVTLLGGEPLLIKDNLPLLEIISNKNVDMHITTNLSMDIEKSKIFLAVKEFNNVTWQVSFENTNERFEYVRHGATWDQFHKNILLLKEYRKNRNWKIDARCNYNVYSAFDLDAFYDYLTTHEIGVRWGKLQYPEELDIMSHNKEVKARAVEEIDRVLSKYDNYVADHRYEFNFLKDLKQSILTVEYTGRLVNFAEWTTWLEQLQQKQGKFNQLWPEVTACF
jgi:organic radical activating enzyme